MADIFTSSDPMTVIRTLEIYNHLRYWGQALMDTLDILHNAMIYHINAIRVESFKPGISVNSNPDFSGICMIM